MEVLRIPLTDQLKPIPNIRTRTFFLVRARLHETLLKDALDSLIRQHWRKLGARLFFDRRTHLWEYRLPPTFDAGYELFRWSSTDTGRPMDRDAPSLAVATPDRLTFLAPVCDFDAAFRPASWPFHLSDDPPDSPLLYVHLSRFTDSSVLAISYPHIFGDQLGLRNLVKAWMGVVAGQAPPPMVGYRDDPMPNKKKYADYSWDEVHEKGQMHVRRRMEYMLVIMGFIGELVLRPSETENILFIPHAIVQSLRERCVREIQARHGEDVRLSDGDVLTGVLTKLSRMHTTRSRKMCLSQTINMRGRIPQLSGTAGDGFLHNAVALATARFRITPKTTVSEIAYRNRQAIAATQQPEFAERNLAVMREVARRKQVMHNCEPLDVSYSVTSWTAAWKGIDLSGAVERSAGDGAGATKTVRPEMHILGHGGEKGAPHRFAGIIMFQSEQGYFCDIGYSTSCMDAVHAYVAADPLLEKL